MLDFDEINALVQVAFNDPDEDMTEVVTDILINAFLEGIRAVEDMLDYSLDMGNDLTSMRNILYTKIDGKTFEDRVKEYTESGDLEAIKTVAETESHRVFEASAYGTAKAIEIDSGRKVGKKWNTRQDGLVRETHVYLEGDVVGLDEKFFTYDGDSAYYAGGFEKAENNCGCRCNITYVFTP